MNARTLTLLAGVALCTMAMAQPGPRQGPGGGPAGGPDGGPGMRGDGPGMRGDGPGMRGDRPGMMGARPGMPEVEMIDVAFLGVEASPVDRPTRAQVRLQGEIGLLVNFVAADSPAQAAGVQQHDVLTKLDDQILVNPHQLQALIRSRKAGDSVKLTLMREGKEQTVTAKLGEHKAPAVTGMPGMRGGMMGPMGEAGMGDPRGMGRMSRALSFGDAAMKVEVSREGESVQLKATDADGKSIFTGPIDTPEQRAKLPQSVQEKLAGVAIEQMVQSFRGDGMRPRPAGERPGDERQRPGARGGREGERDGARDAGRGPGGAGRDGGPREGGPREGGPRDGARDGGRGPGGPGEGGRGPGGGPGPRPGGPGGPGAGGAI